MADDESTSVYVEPDFDEDVAAEARGLARRLAAETDDDTAYDRALELHGLLAVNLAEKVPTALYLIWSELTDSWELHPERRVESARKLREAADDLASAETAAAVEAHLSRWCGRLGISRASAGRRR